MPCSPAVTRMNVKPRLDQTLDNATEVSAVPGSRSSPGLLITGNRSLSQPTFDSAPTSGCSRNSHIRLDTATDVATVDEKTARNTPIPRRCLSAEHGQADAEHEPERHRDQGELGRDPQRVLELGRQEGVDVLVPAVGHAVDALHVAALLPEHDRPPERIQDERDEDHQGRGEQGQRRRQLLPPLPSARARRHVAHVTPRRSRPASVNGVNHSPEQTAAIASAPQAAGEHGDAALRPASADLDRIEHDLAGVEAALERLDAGTYWTDEVSGEPIPDDVLIADPVARRTADRPMKDRRGHEQDSQVASLATAIAVAAGLGTAAAKTRQAAAASPITNRFSRSAKVWKLSAAQLGTVRGLARSAGSARRPSGGPSSTPSSRSAPPRTSPRNWAR